MGLRRVVKFISSWIFRVKLISPWSFSVKLINPWIFCVKNHAWIFSVC